MRTIYNFNEGWSFAKPGEALSCVTLPHTWNAADGQDGGNDYFRGTCTYEKTFARPEMKTNEQVYLEFRGVSSRAEVYLNDTLLDAHDGGYSTFRVNLTSHLENENRLKVLVDNGANRRVYPQKADFTFYGGIYRDVSLIIVPEVHFDLDDHGSTGLKVETEIIRSDEERAGMETTKCAGAVSGTETAKSDCAVSETAKASVRLTAYITGKAGKVRFRLSNGMEAESKVEGQRAEARFLIEDAHLWNGISDPYLYQAEADLIADGRKIDAVSLRFGCRSMEFDPQKGFLLNGKSYPLRGVSRHQDRRGAGNALTPDMHREDMEIIKEMGANTIRLAHYQHDQYFYDLCDEYGMVVWAEIPYITEHLPEGQENTISQMTELIVQCMHHPSIACWGLSNEITVTTGVTEELMENHRILNELCHKLDHSRPTTMAHVFSLETDSPLVQLPDICSYNLYYGWYIGELEENEAFLDKFHRDYPDRLIGLSEYGADACTKWQTSDPQKGDYSEQYQCLYHEHMLQMFENRPWLWATHCWNMFDFAADGRDEGGEHGINQKGLVTFDRKCRKDAFYAYKAAWSREPFVHICGRRYADRPEEETEIKVYSNQEKVSLLVDGKRFAQKEGKQIFCFTVPLTGEHTIEARCGELSDSITIRRVPEPNPAYTLPSAVVHNWFEEPGMEIRPGYFSIQDKMGEISKNEEGAKLIGELMRTARASRGDVAASAAPNPMMQKMLDNMTVEGLVKMAAGAITTEMVVELNQKLCRIKK